MEDTRLSLRDAEGGHLVERALGVEPEYLGEQPVKVTLLSLLANMLAS